MDFEPFKCKPKKMVKYAQTNRWLLPTNCLSVFDYFLALALKGLTRKIKEIGIPKFPNMSSLK